MDCSRCGFSFSNISGALACPSCGSLLSDSRSHKSHSIVETPWESAYASSYPLNALLDTLQQVLFNPGLFFAKIRNTSKKISPAWLYGLITGSFGMIAALLWSVLFRNVTPDALQSQGDLFQPGTLISAPVFISLQLLLAAGYAQFMLAITGARKLPFAFTFRAVCFAESAVILNAIPVLGTVVAPFVWIYLLITALHKLHQISWIKASVILVLPLLFISVLVMVSLIAALLGGLAAGGYLRELFPFLN